MSIPTVPSDTIAHDLALMKKGDDAFNPQDAEAMDAAHHPNLIAHIMGSTEPIRGQAAHQVAMEGLFRAFPDITVDNAYQVQFGAGEWTTVVAKVAGTFTGEMELPDGTRIPGTGRSFDVDLTTTARWQGEHMIEEWVFWDSALMAQQVGLA